MLEQSVAGVIKFVLQMSGNITPYYWKTPEGIKMPAVYFPEPELLSFGDTLNTFAVDCSMFINFFAETDAEAYTLANKALLELNRARSLIKLYDYEGGETGTFLRLENPKAKLIDSGVSQLTIRWTDRVPYFEADGPKMQKFIPEIEVK